MEVSMLAFAPQPRLLAPRIAACRRELLDHARRLVSASDAEDLVQNTLERALCQQHRFAPDANLTTWLRRIMCNLNVDEWRRSRHRAASGVAGDAATVPEAARPWSELTGADVRVAASSLTPQLRAAFELRSAGVSYADIGRQLGVAPGTVGTRLLRARVHVRARLRDMLEAGRPAMRPLPLPPPRGRA
jgi:RNA polymerase sigma-70 factor, ECF subfamily